MNPSHTQGHVEVSEPLGTQRWWHSDDVCFPRVLTYPNAAILLHNCIYTRLVLQSQLHSPELWNIFLRHTYAAPCS